MARKNNTTKKVAKKVAKKVIEPVEVQESVVQDITIEEPTVDDVTVESNDNNTNVSVGQIDTSTAEDCRKKRRRRLLGF